VTSDGTSSVVDEHEGSPVSDAVSTRDTVPALSVVIPTYNRLNQLQRVLASLQAQTYPREKFEVIVVSDGSTDGTDDYLSAVAPPYRMRFVTQPNEGPAAARNRGVDMACGALVLFLDDDVVATPSLVDEHVASHEACDVDTVVIGPMATPPDFEMRPWVMWEQTMLYKQYGDMNNGVYSPTFRQFYTGNASLPRHRFLEVGGFDTRFRRAEDVELAYRLDRVGVRWIWNPNAIGHHYADRSFRSWLRTAREYGVNEVVFGRDERQDPDLRRVSAEFQRRHPVVRWMSRLCVAAPVVDRVAELTLQVLAISGNAVGARRLSRWALSGLFNVAFYGGMASALGSAAEFRRVIVNRDSSTPRRDLSAT
jgi:GT2 family glycosyltransferase